MSDTDEPSGSYDPPRVPPTPPPPPGPWSDRVRYSRRAGGYAYRPGRLTCPVDEADAVSAGVRELGDTEATPHAIGNSGWVQVHFEEAALCRLDIALAVERVAERVDYAPEEGVADGYG